MKIALAGILMYISFVFVALYIVSSINKKGEGVKKLPGTYIRFSQHEFGKEYDTLVVTALNESSKQYNIHRRWLYERVTDGVMEPEYKRTATTAVYKHNETLQEVQTGNIFLRHKTKVLDCRIN